MTEKEMTNPAKTELVDDVLVSMARCMNHYGFDILIPLCLEWYNEDLRDRSPEAYPGSHIEPDEGGAGADALVILVGNTRAVWKKFLESCRNKPLILSSENPFDTYVEKSIENGIQEFEHMQPLQGQRKISRCFWSHHPIKQLDGTCGYVAMQRMAACAGLAYLEESCHLSVSPKYGPWFALRAALVLDGVSAANLKRPPMLECPFPDEHIVILQGMVTELTSRKELHNEEDECEICKQEPSSHDVKESWKRWLKVREAIIPDHPYRYSDDQIYYHYTSNNAFLRSCVANLQSINESVG